MAGSLLTSTITTTHHVRLFSTKLRLTTNLNDCNLIFGREKRHVKCSSSDEKKLGFVDQILDYIEEERLLKAQMGDGIQPVDSFNHSRIASATHISRSNQERLIKLPKGGPKLRKWYGAADPLSADRSSLENEDASREEEEDDDDEVRDAVLVMDGDNEVGQMVILSLIVKRTRVKALVKDKRAAMEAFGTYVEAFSGDLKDSSFLKKALRGVRAIICANEGFLSNAESLKGIQHVVLLSQLSVYRGSSGVQAFMTSNARKLAEQDESVVIASETPYTIIRAGVLKNDRGGKLGFNFTEGSAAEGSLSKEDAAFICMEALDAVPQRGLVFEVVNGEEEVLNWKDCFAALMVKAVQQ